MAGTINVNASVVVANGDYFSSKFTPGLLQVVQTNVGSHETTVKVGTSEEDMAVGDVATPGWLCLRNVHATAIITWGPKSAGAMVAMGTIEPGEYAIFRMKSTATLRWLSSVADSPVQMKLYED